jgi:hypothetical protein
VGNFPQTVPRLHVQLVRLGQNARRLHRPTERRSVNRDHLFPAQTNGQPSRLFAAFVREFHISRPGESIFCSENSGAVPNEKNAGIHSNWDLQYQIRGSNSPLKKSKPAAAGFSRGR